MSIRHRRIQDSTTVYIINGRFESAVKHFKRRTRVIVHQAKAAAEHMTKSQIRREAGRKARKRLQRQLLMARRLDRADPP